MIVGVEETLHVIIVVVNEHAVDDQLPCFNRSSQIVIGHAVKHVRNGRPPEKPLVIRVRQREQVISELLGFFVHLLANLEHLLDLCRHLSWLNHER